MQAGHLVLDLAGHMRGLDQHFCAIMRAEWADMIGRPVLDITAPADREECGEAIRLLCETGRSFRLSKRFIRDDNTLVWVTNTVSMMQGSDGQDMIVATIDPLIADDERQPALLLGSARFLDACQDDRQTVFDAALFPDTAWDAILAAYIAEAEGGAIDVVALAARLNVSLERAVRWVDVLIAQDVLEIETRRSSPVSTKCFRLTAGAHRLLEEHLVRVNELMPRRRPSQRNAAAA
jgi:PAS domain S-box-containing protein